jgi:polyhydroxyalkanoate synthesis regulator phasin
MVKLIVRRSEIDEATETRIKELEAQVKKLEMHTDPVSTSASHVQAPGTTSSRNRHRQLTMVQEIAGRVMDEAAEIRIKELEAQVKKLEDTTRELLGVVDIAELRRRKVRHAFLNAYSRSDKRDHREEGMKAGADCLTDATLYSRGERSDEAVFHAAYGVSPATISRYGKICSSLPFPN